MQNLIPSVSNRDNLTKFLIISFCHRSGGFSFLLANQNARIVRGAVVNCRKANMALDNSASPNSHILIGQIKSKPDLKVVKKMSQSCQKLDTLDCNI